MSQPSSLPSPPTSPARSPLSEKATTATGATTATAVAATTIGPLLPLRATIISPVGDVLIRLLTPTHTLHYKTSASVLITTSKIFSAMLSPTSPPEAQRFNNSPLSSAEPFVLRFHSDDPVALCILLKALHKHPSIPRLLSFKQLVKIAVVVDKYDCSHATRMYGDRWMKGWTSLTEKPGYEGGYSWRGCGVWRKLSENCFGRQ